jgi:hypothetical protein
MKTLFALLMLVCTAAAAQEFGPWSAPVNLGPVINTVSDDMHPTLSKDGLTMIFSSNRPGGAGGLDLWVAQRDSIDSAWQVPQNLTMLNTSFDDHAANFAQDRRWLFFYSTRPGGCNTGRQELWAARRQNPHDDFGWEPPINLGCTLNVFGADDGGPAHWQDEMTGTHYLYFARNYTPSNPNGFEIYVSTCSADLDTCNEQHLWSPGEYVAELNSPGFRNTKTAIRRRDGLEIVVTSNRPGTTGGLDLWAATRASAQDPWSFPADLDIVNSVSNDGAAALSWDGQTMIFYSNRAGGLGGNDLYMSTRERVRPSVEARR